jgi:nitrate reductase NapE component
MPKDKFLDDLMKTPEKREKLYLWFLTAQIVSIALIMVGGVVFILWALGII